MSEQENLISGVDRDSNDLKVPEDKQKVDIELIGDESIKSLSSSSSLSEAAGSLSEKAVDARVEGELWKYMEKRKAVTDCLLNLSKNLRISADAVSTDGLVQLKVHAGSTDDDLEAAEAAVKKLIEDFQSKVTSFQLPGQDAEVIRSLNTDFEERCVISVSGDGSIVVTGTKEEQKNCVDMLRDVWGVTVEANDNRPQLHTDHVALTLNQSSLQKPSAPPTLTLQQPVLPQPFSHTTHSADDVRDAAAAATAAGDGLLVDEMLWKWMSKDESVSEKLSELGGRHGVEVGAGETETRGEEDVEMYGKNVKLTFSGSDAAKQQECKNQLEQLVTECKKEIERKEGTCSSDEAFGKITKQLKLLNRGSCVIVAQNNTVEVIGKKDDVHGTALKLLKYGVNFPGMEEAESTQPSQPPKKSFMESFQQNPSGNGSMGQPFMAGSSQIRPGIQSQRPASQFMPARGQQQQPSGGYSSADSSDYEAVAIQAMTQGSGDDRTADLPLERMLWKYIKMCKENTLMELRDGYGVTVDVTDDDPAAMTGYARVKLSADSAEMLDCGRSAFLQLVEHLQRDIVVAVLPVKFDGAGGSGPGGSQGPQAAELRQLFDMIKGECSTEDSLVECGGDGIYIVAPNHKSQEAQERVANFMRNLTERMQAGRGGMGGSMPGPGMRLGGRMPGPGTRPGGMGTGGMREPIVVDQSGGGYSQVGGGVRSGPIITALPEQRPEDTEKPTSRSQESKPTSVSAETVREVKAGCLEADSAVEGVTQGGYCSACCITPDKTSRDDDSSSCGHTYCLRCIEMYFGCKELECPTCGSCPLDDENDQSKRPQPSDGRMLVNEDSGFKLPGFENSGGTFVVTYMFPAGAQSDDMLAPGQKYNGYTVTTFLPKTAEGLKIIDLLRRAFERRIVFTFNEKGHLTFNGIRHKTNIYGGPQQSGYPDPVYMRRVETDLLSKGIKYNNKTNK